MLYIDPVDDWVSVDVRLPDYGHAVLIGVEGEARPDYGYINRAGVWHWTASQMPISRCVLEWMDSPLTSAGRAARAIGQEVA